jgi:Right handed beta helix region
VGDGREGPHQTVLRVTNSGNFAAVFWIRNVSNVSIHDLRFEGSSYESGCSRHLDYGHAIYVYSDAGEHPGVDDVAISQNAFHNFNGQSWIALNAQPSSPGIGQSGKITIDNNIFESDASLRGGCSATAGISYPTAMVWLHGSDTSAQGLVSNVSVESNTFDAGFVKGAVAIWSGTRQITVKSNVVRDVGAGLPPAPGTELGRYGILIYNSAHELRGLHPDAISILENEITNPVSCGIYVAAAQNLDISRNRISGQRDRFDGTLPKGAIALNHATKVLSLNDNELVNNYIGISSVGSELNLGANRIAVPNGGSATKIMR